MSRADDILRRYNETVVTTDVTEGAGTTLESFVEGGITCLNERDKLTQQLVAGQLPREAEFWNLTLDDLTKITGLKRPRMGSQVHDLIMWLTRSANRWRKSIFYQDLVTKKANLRNKKNAFVWVGKGK